MISLSNYLYMYNDDSCVDVRENLSVIFPTDDFWKRNISNETGRPSIVDIDYRT